MPLGGSPEIRDARRICPDEVFVLFDLPKEQTVYAYPSGAFGWLGIVSQGFRPELMTKDSSGAKLLTIARL